MATDQKTAPDNTPSEAQLLAIVAAIIYAADMSYGIPASIKDAIEVVRQAHEATP
jgi:hypothetical protein